MGKPEFHEAVDNRDIDYLNDKFNIHIIEEPSWFVWHMRAQHALMEVHKVGSEWKTMKTWKEITWKKDLWENWISKMIFYLYLAVARLSQEPKIGT